MRRRHICSERLDLPSWTRKNMLLFCKAFLLTLCVWEICGEPRLALCWPFKFKIQLVSPQRARGPHRGAGANSSSWHTWRCLFLLFLSCLLLLRLLLPLTLLHPPHPPFVSLCSIPPSETLQHRGSDAVSSRQGGQETPSQSAKLRRICVCLCERLKSSETQRL